MSSAVNSAPLVRVALLLATLLAQSATRADEPVAPAAPSVELLEFLGAWETDGGEWIDPAVLEQDAVDELLDSAAATAEKSDNDDD